MNPWKIISIIFVLLIIGLSFNIYSQNKNLDFGAFKINKIVFEDIMNYFDTDQPVMICKISENKCLTFTSTS